MLVGTNLGMVKGRRRGASDEKSKLESKEGERIKFQVVGLGESKIVDDVWKFLMFCTNLTLNISINLSPIPIIDWSLTYKERQTHEWCQKLSELAEIVDWFRTSLNFLTKWGWFWTFLDRFWSIWANFQHFWTESYKESTQADQKAGIICRSGLHYQSLLHFWYCLKFCQAQLQLQLHISWTLI